MRRADDNESVLGAKGGNNVWNVFMSRVRCGGVVGEGGGNDASTSWNKSGAR